jgi:predicted pyridoxine 5'-phosphate oxidase superfamily flavin-nucleotide-binding protein
MATDDTSASASPFHDGERKVQSRVVGSAERVARLDAIGGKMIVAEMSDQHREFFAQLPMFLVATVDALGRPWASALVGAAGFLSSPDPRHIHVAARPLFGDPLNEILRDDIAIGGLGIELHSRRRNRVNGRVTVDPDGSGFTIRVDQSFGNCPKYIQARQFRFRTPPVRGSEEHPVRRGDRLDDAARAIVARADTLFIASHFGGDPDDRTRGADVSHRGGRPGFVQIVDDRTLVMPDYIGNFLFNTLGNIVADPRCGLLFLDFDSGDTLQLTGHGEILWDWPRDDPAFRDAQRLVRFRADAAVHVSNVLPLGWEFLGYAPQLAGE